MLINRKTVSYIDFFIFRYCCYEFVRIAIANVNCMRYLHKLQITNNIQHLY